MEPVRAVSIRLHQDDKQTLSEIHFYQGVKRLLTVKCLELPDRGNQRSISRVNAGTYKCVLRWSQKYGWHFILLDVDGRDYILIHIGNYYTSTRGCLIVGNNFADINKDGYLDVTSSGKTLQRILDLPGDEFQLTIIDE